MGEVDEEIDSRIDLSYDRRVYLALCSVSGCSLLSAND